MVKSELINRITAQQKTLSSKDVELSINRILECMSITLGQGERIEIRGFGSFSLHYRPPRKAHNPKTGERVYTEAKYTPHFKPGKDLRERVNNNRTLYPIREINNVDADAIAECSTLMNKVFFWEAK
ncbi:MAG: integration host factor subunit beta [Coxiella-like endosymbiont]|uniref:integration host factor subunit beta n=1 Tax=Coxiella-like endosymbiont TaxID=1592897 RepID=UPI00215A4A5E|nr:integration host factor subunit beta [Coxiella-like endosymbiont]UVE59310.1 integration host factor subunit beta [Coxiella-like endosymbiont]